MSSTSANIEEEPCQEQTQPMRNVKRKNGLLNTKIAARSESMKVAQRNSLESPLLRLPAEIRNRIWRYTVGEHHISVRFEEQPICPQIKPRSPISALRKDETPSSTFVHPSFSLPKVCRQLYVEASPMVYTLNTFSFDHPITFDCFIRMRSPGQRRLVTSIDIPYHWYGYYNSGIRKHLSKTFPNIERVGVHATAEWENYRGESEAERIAEFIRAKEGRMVEIDCYIDSTQ